ncbi:hypothetical protein MKX01_014106, partial [Papaver californicum]
MGIITNFRNSPMVIFLVNLYLLSYYLFLVFYAANTIRKGESIRDGETLISRDQNFELGFFSPLHSTNRYVGIWYYKIAEKSTTVWVANRDNPVLDKSGLLTLTNDGDLMVLNGTGKSIWSTNTTIESRKAEFDPSKALWQSFDFPTDTFLPNMRIWVSKTGLKKQIYTSWKSKSDPSTGNFSSGIDSWRSPQIVIWEGSQRLWRIFIRDMEWADIYFTYSLPDVSVYMRFQIQSGGTMEELRWDNEKKERTVYCKCGTYGSCSMLNSENCNCLVGFVPKSDDNWKNGNWSSGCQRKNELQCEKNGGQVGGDGFLELDEVKLPDSAQIKPQFSNKDDCENECLNNCSCKAYASVSGIGCLTWDQDLSDIQKFQAGGNQLHKMTSAYLPCKSKKGKLAILISVLLGVVCLSIFAYLLWRNKNKSKDPCNRKRKETASSGPLSKSKEMSRDFSGEDVGEGEENGPELPLFSFNTIEIAANNFSISNKLGHGGFGDVYK